MSDMGGIAAVSSHILDSVTGGSAAGIRARLFHCDAGGGKTLVFDVFADTEGRICESVEADNAGGEYELVLHSADYFSGAVSKNMNERSIVESVVIRFVIPAPGMRCHIPVMLSPHSYSVWWSQ